MSRTSLEIKSGNCIHVAIGTVPREDIDQISARRRVRRMSTFIFHVIMIVLLTLDKQV